MEIRERNPQIQEGLFGRRPTQAAPRPEEEEVRRI
jgi:hypothetical protein